MTDSQDFEVLTPLVTPFDAEGELDTDGLASLVTVLADEGVDGFVPVGTTGEFETLSEAEYQAAVETTVDAAPADATVIPGVSGTAISTVRDRLQFAADVGADAGLIVPPYYGGQASDAGNQAFFERALADAPVPAYLYNIPAAAGQELTVETTVALAEHDAVAGLKDTGGDLTSVTEVLEQTPSSFTVYQGHDGILVPSLLMGADGAISALSHLVPGALREARSAVRNGDVEQARQLQRTVFTPLARACFDHGFAPTVKAVLADRGTIDRATVRPPRTGLDESALADVLAALP